jgi:hypothetical protein
VIEYTLPPDLKLSKFPDGGSWPWYRGRPIRSVSKILERIYPMPPGLPQWYLDRGKMVHHATTLIDAGTLDWETLDDRLRPFCEAYRDFIDVVHPVVEASELTVVHRSYSYGARLDRVYKIPGSSKPILVDIKTGTGKEKRYWLQCIGCLMALDEDNALDYEVGLLNLDKDGKPHFDVDTDVGTLLNEWRQVLQDDMIAKGEVK